MTGAATGRGAAACELRDKNGYSSYLEVLDAQRNCSTTPTVRAGRVARPADRIVDLYRALGGGWAPDNSSRADRSVPARRFSRPDTRGACHLGGWFGVRCCPRKHRIKVTTAATCSLLSSW